MIVFGQVLAPLLLFLYNLLRDAIKLSIFGINLINQLLILLNILYSSILNLFQKSDILRLYLLLLLLILLNELLNLPNLHLELLKLFIVVIVHLGHLMFGLISDLLSLLQRILSHYVILIQILRHVFEFVQVS